jgi:hypothetical protein
MLPIFISAVNAVPAPVTAVDAIEVVMVPVRSVFGQAVAAHVPVATLVMDDACSGVAVIRTKLNASIRISRRLKTFGFSFLIKLTLW